MLGGRHNLGRLDIPTHDEGVKKSFQIPFSVFSVAPWFKEFFEKTTLVVTQR